MTPTARAVAFGPGRVNLIGEHTDYNGGLSLPFAIAEGVTVEAAEIGGDSIEAHACDLDEMDSFPVGDPGPAEGWRAFVRGIAAELQPPAARLTIHGTVPQGSGVSSSAALSVALCLALLALDGRDGGADRIELARLCSRVENEWVGAQTGLLDQIASLCGSEGETLRIDFRTLGVERVPLRLGDWKLVLVDSGEQHSNAAAGGYNERRRECSEAARQIGVEFLSDADREAAGALPEPLRRRALHVLDENERVDQAVLALRADDMPRLGRLLDASHASLRDQYDASTAAVERTVAGLAAGGAAGARMMGGGFGGHVLALLPPGTAPPPGARGVAPAAGARVELSRACAP